MELPKRKNNRLKDYDYSLNGAYFITICTHDRQSLFWETNNPDAMIEKWLFEIQNKYANVQIDKVVIMPNHIHAIVFLLGDQSATIHQIISWFKTMTTNEYIRAVKDGLYKPFKKQIWQRSYHDHIIRNEEDYLHIWQYIDDNPLKWTDDKYFTL